VFYNSTHPKYSGKNHSQISLCVGSIEKRFMYDRELTLEILSQSYEAGQTILIQAAGKAIELTHKLPPIKK